METSTIQKQRNAFRVVPFLYTCGKHGHRLRDTVKRWGRTAGKMPLFCFGHDSVQERVLPRIIRKTKGQDGAGMTVSPWTVIGEKHGKETLLLLPKSDKNHRGIDFDEKQFRPKMTL